MRLEGGSYALVPPQRLPRGFTLVELLVVMGQLDRTLVMTFSEFGRRVAENEQQGTDHGTASVMFLAGDRVKAGVHGGLLDLTDLDEGDPKFKTDFRSVIESVAVSGMR